MKLIEEIRPLPQGWRFCLAKNIGGDKRPYEKGWPKLDLDAEAIGHKLSHGRCTATMIGALLGEPSGCLLYTSPSPRDS